MNVNPTEYYAYCVILEPHCRRKSHSTVCDVAVILCQGRGYVRDAPF